MSDFFHSIENVPYTDLHNLNLDWIVNNVKIAVEEWRALRDGYYSDKNNIWKAIEDLKSYVKNYFAGLDLTEEVSDKIDDLIEQGLFPGLFDKMAFGYSGVEVVSHISERKTDTSYLLIKLEKSKYEIDFHNCSGNDENGPTTLLSNPLDFLSTNFAKYRNYMMVSNCNYGGNDYPGRLDGVDYEGTNFTRRLLAFDTSEQEISITEDGALISSVDQRFDTVFAVDSLLIENGVAHNPPSTDTETRVVLGWDNTYWYYLICEGRGPLEKGLTRAQCRDIMAGAGALNAINLDGGGSVCLALNLPNNPVKINKYRDTTLPWAELREVGLAMCFKATSSYEKTVPLDVASALLAYKANKGGYQDVAISASYNVASPSGDFVANAHIDIPISTRLTLSWARVDNDYYVYDTEKSIFPVPCRHYLNGGNIVSVEGFVILQTRQDSVPASSSKSVNVRLRPRKINEDGSLSDIIWTRYYHANTRVYEKEGIDFSTIVIPISDTFSFTTGYEPERLVLEYYVNSSELPVRVSGSSFTITYRAPYI